MSKTAQAVTKFFGSWIGIVSVGAAIGVSGVLLQRWGNPPNAGLCIACFLRDIAGAIGLHRAAPVQYIRPEISGLVLGALIAAFAFREFRPRGGSAPIARFMLGIFAMIGAMAFLGCPYRALLRLAGGDMTAVVGLIGLVTGVALGTFCLRKGFDLGRSRPMPGFAGWMMPLFMVLLFVLVLFKVSFKEGQAIFFSAKGPGAMHAGVWISLIVGLIVGFLGQRTRFCTMGAIRDVLLIRNYNLVSGVAAFILAAFAVNLILGRFTVGYVGMPIAHSSSLWLFLGMVLAGWCFTLAGACPGRSLFLSGEGDGDAAIFIMGMLVAGGLAHNFFMAGVPDKLVEGAVKVGGISGWGQIAVIVGLVFCAVLGLTARKQAET
jgi:YedE family putative selenium metabolism protein